MTPLRPEETTLLLILDACRADYLESGEMPYLDALRKESLSGMSVSPPGFAQRTAMFTGTYPDTSQNFSAYGYDPENSPFAWMRRLGALRNIYQPTVFLLPVRKGIRGITKKVTGNFHTDPAWIRGQFLPYFGLVEDTQPIYEAGALPFESIFDLCRRHGRTFYYGAHPVSGDDNEIHRLLMEQIERRDPTDLYIGQFSALDEGGHPHGPYLPASWQPAPDQSDRDVAHMKGALAEIDRKVRTLHEALLANYEKVNLLIVGDHGMAPVRRRIDILSHVRNETKLRAGEDFVVFIDSTFAKFWFHNETARARITELLAGAEFGRILEEEEREGLRINFKHRRYGDLMFAAGVGVLFWPDYFHVRERPIKGMHGYIDKHEETYGALVLSSPHVGAPRRVGQRVLVDIFPTLADLLRVPVPEHCEGYSLTRGEAVQGAARIARTA
jgi:hypothetical protein